MSKTPMFPPALPKPRVITGILILFLLTELQAAADTIYRTDFENFAVGPNKLAGADGWNGNSLTSGSHGIVQDAIPGGGLGKTAFIGYAPPTGSTNPVLVYRAVNLNPATNSESVIEFESLLGINDSTNSYRDEFWISFFNIPGNRLASIRFQNDSPGSVIFRSDGMAPYSTGLSFIPGELHLLNVRIDLNMNRWSAFLDGIPLFNGTTFTALSATRTLGNVAMEWRRGARPIGVTTWGDNWMLVADWVVRTVPFALESSSRNANGSFTLKWIGDPGRSYQVQYSSDIKVWQNTLPGSTFPTQSATGTLSFTNDVPLPENRFYRVTRSP